MSDLPSSAPPRDVLGRPLHDLRISVIETCNYRCPYCMPEGLTPDETPLDRASRLDFDEIETAVRAFARLGVSKLRLTGGEPLLRKRLPELVARLAAVPGIEDLALTTNGSLLASQARALREAGLHRLTVSLDALDPALFRQLSGGRGNIADVFAGIDAAQAAGFRSIKINCVVQRGLNDAQALAIAERFRGTPHVPRFIEYMDVGNCNGWRREGWCPRPSCATASTRAGRCVRSRPPIAAKWPRGTVTWMAAAKWASSARSATRSAATATGRACRPTGSCSPACSPPAASRCASTSAAAKTRWPNTWRVCGACAQTDTANSARRHPPTARRSKCST